MKRVRIVLFAGAALWAHPASAADALKFGPPPAWVKQQAIPQAKPTDAPISLLLTDQQIAFDVGKISTYSEVAFKIENPQGLDAGNLSIGWEPSTDTVTVNKLRIIRGGKVIDVLGAGQTFTVMRRETNLDAAVLDGTLTANIQPEGLQQGDIIDFATTTENSDPILKGHVEATFAQWNGTPLQAGHVRLSWPAGIDVNLRESQGLPAARRSTSDGRAVAEISAIGVDPPITPKGAPNRFTIGRLGEATDFGSWADVAQLMLPLYREAARIPASGTLHDELEKIRSASNDPKIRAAQALALVQDRVRYVALLMGQGGYVPASAEQTWSRRFGDCKGKTALLLALLGELGIDAEPVLVNTSLGDVVADRLPMLDLFNHVLIRARIGGKDYWLDGTRTGDTSLDGIQVPDFGWGLPLVDHAELTHLVPAAFDIVQDGTTLDIDASGGVYVPAPAHAEQVLRGDLAVAAQMGLSSLSEAQRQAFFQSYWLKNFDFITFKSGSATFDKAKRELHLTMTGEAKLDWSDGYFHVPDSTVGYHPDLSRPQGPLHDAPFAVAYPGYSRWVVKLHLPPGFMTGRKLGSADLHETLAGVEYRRTAAVSGDTLTVDTSARSVVPEVSYKDAKAAEARLTALSDEDISLPLPNSYRTTKSDVDAMKKGNSASTDDLVTRGNVLLNNGKFDEALDQLNKALAIDPKNVTALADRGVAYVWLKKRELAEKDLGAALSMEPGNAIALRGSALLAELDRNCASAIDSYTKSLKSEPENGFALAHRGICETELHRDAAALADIDAALKQSPDWSQLRFLRLELLARKGEKDAVLREAELAIKEDPNAPAAADWLVVSKILARNGMRGAALDAVDRAIAIKAEPSLYVEKAKLRQMTDYSGRMADIEAALKLDPEDFSAIVAKADLIASRGDRQGALAIYDAAIKRDPALSVLTINRAILLYQSGRKAEAVHAINEWRRLAGTATELTQLCSRKATAGVMLESAEKDCGDALKKNANFTQAMQSLGLVELRLGKWDAAIAQYDRAIELGDGAASYMGRAIAYSRKGDAARANADRSTALSRDADIGEEFAQYDLKFQTAGVAAAATAPQQTSSTRN